MHEVFVKIYFLKRQHVSYVKEKLLILCLLDRASSW